METASLVCEPFDSTLEQEQKEQVASSKENTEKKEREYRQERWGERERERQEEGLIRLLLRPKSPLPIGLVLPEATTFPQL